VAEPDDPISPPPTTPGVPAPATRPPIDRVLAALVLCAAATLLVAWLAFLISRSGVAPVILFPIGIGAAIGVAQTMILRKLGVFLRPVLAVGMALALGVLAVATEDYQGYGVYLEGHSKIQRDNPLASAAGAASDGWQPLPFTGYLTAVVRRSPIWWTVDVALTLMAAAAVAVITGRAKSASGREIPPG
jgi:hypothetical protein